MADEDDIEALEARKPSKLPLIIGLVLGLAGAGGGYFAVSSGMILGPADAQAALEPQPAGPDAIPDITFVDVQPMTISLNPAANNQHLIFRAKLEVPSQYESDVTLLLPRVVDVLNGYLRALEIGDLESPAALTRLRAQMLRRIQVVTGEGRVNDLLIMEFVLN